MLSKSSSTRRQAGFTMIGLAILIAATSLLTLSYARKQIWVAQAAAGAAMGDSLSQVAAAVENYRSTNFLTLTGGAPAVAGFANANAPTVAELLAAGYLSPGVANQWPDGNTYNVRMFLQPAGCVGPAATCNVYSVLWMTNPIVDELGNPDVHRLGPLVAELHGAGSYSAPGEGANITGGSGAWTIANPDPAARAGIVVAVGGLGGTWPQFLRVGDPRDPSFTGQMTVAKWIKPTAGPGQTVTAGTACAAGVPNGAMANDTNGRLLSCQGGTWVSPDGSKSTVLQAITSVPGGTVFPVLTCAPGGAAWAAYTAQSSGVNFAMSPPNTQLTFSVAQGGGNWTTLTQSGGVAVNNNAAVLGFVPMGTFMAGCTYP